MLKTNVLLNSFPSSIHIVVLHIPYFCSPRDFHLGREDIQLGYKESVEDTARVLGRMFDGIEFRFKFISFLHTYCGIAHPLLLQPQGFSAVFLSV